MTSPSALRYAAFWTALFLILTVGVGSLVAHAEEETPLTPDAQCAADGGTWSGEVCTMPEPEPAQEPEPEPAQEPEPEPAQEEPAAEPSSEPAPEELTAATSSDPAPADLVIATSTDGTGGQSGGTVVTGDATASTTVENELNTNVASDVDSEGKTNSSSITASTTNTADLGSESESLAQTGENEAEGGESFATVVTGSAVATANVINLVNTNIFNSEGLILFLNQLFGGGLDLRTFNLSYFFDGEAGASPTVAENGDPQCTLLTCLNSSELNVVNDNDATVTNSVIVRAATGENTASSTESGGASIDTGDAYAAANVLNVVNTNIINSSYLLVSFNNFGSLAGDITLPNADFFSQLLAQGGAMPELNSSTYGINNTNTADFVGTTTANAETGDNTASTTGSGSGVISTGDAYSSASTFTDANSNYFGGTSALFLFRVSGNWSGSVIGLPAGMSWARVFDGSDTSSSTLILVTSDNSGVELPEAPEANCDRDEGPVSNCFNSSSFLASSTNSATVENSVDVSAETGENETFTEDGDASISTGNAYAVANVVNLINTNIVGRNWIFAVFNVFGDWSGDISFGQSELQLEALADAQSPIRPGSDVVYRFTVFNNGDADAEDVVLKADFDKNLLTFGAEAGAAETDSGTRWGLGTIARGEKLAVDYTARVGAIPAGTSLTIPLTATVSSKGADENNGISVLFTVVTVDVASPAPAPARGGGGGGGVTGLYGSVAGPATAEPKISVTKSVSIGTTTIPTTVDYKVVVTNDKNAGPAYQSLLTDTLYNPSGGVMYNRSWNLDTVEPGDQITLTYSVEYAASTTPGIYHNVARVTGKMSYVGILGTAITPVEGYGDVELQAGGLVLGVATSTPEVTDATCQVLLTTHLRRGMRNNILEVKKLQQFLAADRSLYPAGLITGHFGPLTDAAVRRFQLKYASDILAPWNLSAPTGNVYSTTLRKINELACK